MVSRIKNSSEAEILSKIVGPQKASLSAPAAKSLLKLRFTSAQERRMRELAEKNSDGTITGSERNEMEDFARVGNFLSLIQSKARLSLRAASET